eukprot:2092273-Pleurochrysis_carterae.AAC.4
MQDLVLTSRPEADGCVRAVFSRVPSVQPVVQCCAVAATDAHFRMPGGADLQCIRQRSSAAHLGALPIRSYRTGTVSKYGYVHNRRPFVIEY